jgi:hypothetical protein
VDVAMLVGGNSTGVLIDTGKEVDGAE